MVKDGIYIEDANQDLFQNMFDWILKAKANHENRWLHPVERWAEL